MLNNTSNDLHTTIIVVGKRAYQFELIQSLGMKAKKWRPPPLNKKCKVCGDPASSIQHYGALVCYSCRFSMF